MNLKIGCQDKSWAVVTLLIGLLATPLPIDVYAQQTAQPYPPLIFPNSYRSIVAQVKFHDELTASVSQVDIVSSLARGNESNPPLIGVEVEGASGRIEKKFNAWHPSWTFTFEPNSKEDNDISHRINRERLSVSTEPGLILKIIFPFRESYTTLHLWHIPKSIKILTYDLVPHITQYCLDNPDDCTIVD